MRRTLFTALLTLLTAAASAMPIRPADSSIETILAAVREKHAPDDFTAYFDVSARWQDGVLYLSGHSDSLEAVAELRAAVLNAHLPTKDTIELVPQRNDLREKIWAVVNQPSVRALSHPRYVYPLPIPLGTPVQRLLDMKDGTSLVRLPDSHLALLEEKSLRLATETEIFIWNRQPKVSVTRPNTPLFASEDLSGTPRMTLPAGARLRLCRTLEKAYHVALPDHSQGYLSHESARELFAFQREEETLRRESPERFTARMADSARTLVHDVTPENEALPGLTFLSSLFARHDLILPADADLLAQAFPETPVGRHGDRLRAGDLLLFRNDRGIRTLAFVTAPGRFVTSGYPDARLGTPSVRPLGRLVRSLRPDYGFLNDPCLTSTRSNPFYQTPAVKLVPCRQRQALDKIR